MLVWDSHASSFWFKTCYPHQEKLMISNLMDIYVLLTLRELGSGRKIVSLLDQGSLWTVHTSWLPYFLDYLPTFLITLNTAYSWSFIEDSLNLKNFAMTHMNIKLSSSCGCLPGPLDIPKIACIVYQSL